MAYPGPPPQLDPFIVTQISQSLFGDRFIIFYDNIIQFHNHCYSVERINEPSHPYYKHYYLVDVNSKLAMRTDIECAPLGSYGAIFDPETGEIVGYDQPETVN